MHPIFASLGPSHAPTQSPPSLGIRLSHLESRDANTPRTNVRLDIPLPPLQSAPSHDDWRVSLLSWSPDSSQLLAVVSSPSPTSHESDLLALFEHSGACIDEGWNLVALERVSRFGAPAAPVLKKKVVAVRWVGEPRRWYPAPAGLHAQMGEAADARKPLYCAPPRSAPLEGTAFVCVLSSEEVRHTLALDTK